MAHQCILQYEVRISCASDDECSGGKKCLPQDDGSSTCVSACKTDHDCPPNRKCADHVCVPHRKCVGDEDCAAGEACRAGACLQVLALMPKECASDADCGPLSARCVGGECVTDDIRIDVVVGCETSDDCDRAEVCAAGECRALGKCGSHADCPTATLCSNNQCTRRTEWNRVTGTPGWTRSELSKRPSGAEPPRDRDFQDLYPGPTLPRTEHPLWRPETMESGRPRPFVCSSNADCADSERCSAGRCVIVERRSEETTCRYVCVISDDE